VECKGLLFDLDGTLVDSLVAVERAWIKWAVDHHCDPQEVVNYIHGKQAVTSLRHFMPGASEEEIQKEFAYLEQVESTDTEGIIDLPGAKALLNRLIELNIPWAIVTSGSNPVARARVKAGGLPIPEIFITAEQVSRGKPEPDAYLLGAQRLGFKPQECVVIEDAPAGIASALAAGCQVLAVNAPLNTPKLDQVDKLLTSLAQIEVEYAAGMVTLSFRP
jgi:sugar-phosphatase